MRWLVEVATEGHSRLIGDLLATMNLSLLQADGLLCLSGGALDKCATAVEARSAASRVCEAVTNAGKYENLDVRLYMRPTIIERSPSGADVSRHTLTPITGNLSVGLAGCVLTATGSVGASQDEIQRREAERREQEYQRQLRVASIRALSAHRSEDAAKVQRLLAGDLSPLAMGQISEVIESQDTDMRLKFASKSQWSRFDRSINHPDVFGDLARHGKSNAEPPPNPLTLDEAQQFIRVVAVKWLEMVAA